MNIFIMIPIKRTESTPALNDGCQISRAQRLNGIRMCYSMDFVSSSLVFSLKTVGLICQNCPKGDHNETALTNE